MKKVLSIAAMALAVVFVFTSCNKEKTMTQKLTIEKGWTMTKASCPAGYGANNVTDLYAMFESAGGYENDDIMKFKEDGSEYINAGSVRYDFEGEGDQYVGKWEFNDKETVLSCQLSVFKAETGAPDTEIYSATKEECEIITLDENEMVLSHTFTVGNGNAKWQEGTWTFQFTFVHAK
ncbi:MAG: hypothetical protein IJT61_03310 [Bacteroidales bacterium]|nr:hypothetical protein [Bacteroidales bacterium]